MRRGVLGLMELFIAYIDIDGRYLHIKLQLSRREQGGVDRTNPGICKYNTVAFLELGFPRHSLTRVLCG